MGGPETRNFWRFAVFLWQHKTMKTRNVLIQNAALLGVTASLLALPFGAAAAGITFALTGVQAIIIADYGRKIEPLSVTADVVPMGEPGRPTSDYRAAA